MRQRQREFAVIVAAVAGLMSLPALANQNIDQCIAQAGFNRHQECISQTSGLGQCNMCCTAIYNCTLWHGRPREIHIALSEAHGCRGHCEIDFS